MCPQPTSTLGAAFGYAAAAEVILVFLVQQLLCIKTDKTVSMVPKDAARFEATSTKVAGDEAA